MTVRLDDRTMRAIGQDLETIDVTDFDLTLDGEKCVVFRKESSSHGAGGSFDDDPENVLKVYLSSDIDRLVTAAESLRAAAVEDKLPDLRSVAEILRVLAAYCEVAGLEPIRVTKRGERLRYEYRSESAQDRVEERRVSDLHRFARGMVQQRQPTPSTADQD